MPAPSSRSCPASRLARPPKMGSGLLLVLRWTEGSSEDCLTTVAVLAIWCTTVVGHELPHCPQINPVTSVEHFPHVQIIGVCRSISPEMICGSKGFLKTPVNFADLHLERQEALDLGNVKVTCTGIYWNMISAEAYRRCNVLSAKALKA